MRKVVILIFLVSLLVLGCKDKKSKSITKISDSSNEYGALIGKYSLSQQGIAVGCINVMQQINSVFVSVDEEVIEMENDEGIYIGFFDAQEGDIVNVRVKINGKELIKSDIELIYNLDAFNYPPSFNFNSSILFSWEREKNVDQQYFETTKEWNDFTDAGWQEAVKCVYLNANTRSYNNNISWMGDGQSEAIIMDFSLHSMNYKRDNGLILASMETSSRIFRNYSREIEETEVTPVELFHNFKRIVSQME